MYKVYTNPTVATLQQVFVVNCITGVFMNGTGKFKKHNSNYNYNSKWQELFRNTIYHAVVSVRLLQWLMKYFPTDVMSGTWNGKVYNLLEDLINPGLGHGELEEDPEESDHDEGPRRPEDAQVAEARHHSGHLEHLQDHRHPQKEHHWGVELAPVVLQVWDFALEQTVLH